MLGPPGAGKGTQSLLCAQAHGIPHISTGEMFRAAIREGTELGERVERTLAAGELVSDDTVVAMVRERLGRPDCARGFLFDGYPRTLAQAHALDVLLKELRLDLTHVIDLKVAQTVLLERIRKRGEGRADDSAEVAANRLKVYWEQTAPVAKYYAGGKAALVVVDGLGSVEEVHKRVEEALAKGS